MDLYAKMQGGGQPSQRFKLDVILEKLPDDEAESVLCALNDVDVLSTKISEVLSNHGHPVSPNAVRNYRLHKCIKS